MILPLYQVLVLLQRVNTGTFGLWPEVTALQKPFPEQG